MINHLHLERGNAKNALLPVRTTVTLIIHYSRMLMLLFSMKWPKIFAMMTLQRGSTPQRPLLHVSEKFSHYEDTLFRFSNTPPEGFLKIIFIFLAQSSNVPFFIL